MNWFILRKFGFVLMLIGAQTVGLYFVVKPERPAVAAELPLADDLPTPGQINAKNAAITQCRVEQKGIPVMTFGFKVACINRDVVIWIR